MPPKKRAIGRYTPKAQNVQLARATETSERRDVRLASDRQQHAELRSSESSECRITRQQSDRKRHCEVRSAESSENREARRNADRQHHAEVRSTETSECRITRQQSDRERHCEVRSAESSENREARRNADRQHHSEVRSTESRECRITRQQSDRERHSEMRSAESSETREARRNADREHHAEARSTESSDHRTIRRTADRERHARNIPHAVLELAAFCYDPERDYDLHVSVIIGEMEKLCLHCNALKFANEPPGLCCAGGKVRLPELSAPPEPLSSLLSGCCAKSKKFLQHIRKYNSCFQMTSFGAGKIVRDDFMPTFKIQGQVYHRARSLLPMPDKEHTFLQIYFMGNIEEQTDQRCRYIRSTDREIVSELEVFFEQHNELVKLFKTALTRMPTDDYVVVIRADKTPVGQHERQYNAPTIDEVAIVVVGEGLERRDIALHRRGGNVQYISETHRCYDALQYPILFWQGEDGYHFNIKMVNPITGEETNKKVSAMNYYAYRLMVRQNTDNHLLKCRALLHQYIVDMYAKIESERLLFIRLNQSKLRSDEYIHLRDAINNDANIDPNHLGKAFILPATFTGSPRHMHEYAQDAMAYVRAYGRPDLFITFTCNPRWIEIKKLLIAGQASTDRHDITARVFKQKLKMLMNYITKHHVFGETRCWMYSVEWQKRGLPHAHILIWLMTRITPDQIDQVISAEIPDRELDPGLFDVVINNMVHGPCGTLNMNSVCMVDGKCTKRFPKPFVVETISGNDGYPLYRRRSPEDGGRSATVNGRIDIDNRWIVPFSPLLSKTFKAHINVEFCHSVKSIKYITKYVNKGSDMAVIEVKNTAGPPDEIAQYQLGRYISSNEAVWRIISFPIHERHPTVTHLAVHLENGQRVYFTANTARQRALAPPPTTLTAFFALCQEDIFAKTLLYSDIPSYYTWNASAKKFQRRKQGKAVAGHSNLFSSDALGRLYTVHPTNAECFYLRLLLINVRGPTSFNHLKTVNGQVCATFREACQKLNLLENDAHWDIALTDATDSARPQQIRTLFAIILTTCCPSNPGELWQKHKDAMSEDILHRMRTANQNLDIQFGQNIYNETLIAIEDTCLSIGNKSLPQVSMPAPNRDSNNILDRDMRQETGYDTEELASFVETNIRKTNAEQRAVYDTIMNAVAEQKRGFFFLDAPGGTGKTFLISLILASLRAQHKIALAIASTGIAATLLAGGRTAHSALKLPLNLHINEAPTCNISKSSGMGNILRTSEIIIWDECTMTHRKALEALNRTLKDIRSNNELFGGALILMSGDFRQTLPVIPRSTPADELHACLKSSVLWPYVRKLRLKINMRVQLTNDTSTTRFAKQLLDIGNGKIPVDESKCMTFPAGFCQMVASKELLITKVFPDIALNHKNHQWLSGRAILAPKNLDVNAINICIQDSIDGNDRTYLSIDTVTNTEEIVNYPTEFLNSLDLPGLPPHVLKLKVGVPIILLRNIHPPRLCNGTRLAVKRLMDNIIEATILNGSFRGEDVLLPRIPLIPTDMPFNFKRLQFPVRLAFAMTINKAQGQSLDVCGLDLERSCFSHGQLYVACSRVGNAKNLFIFAPGGKTKNITYPTALQ